MNKELFGFLFFFISLLVGALYYTNAIQSPLIETTSYFKTSYHQSIKSIKEGFSKHFYQADKIKNLREELQDYEKNKLIVQELSSELHDLFKENKSPFKTDPEVALVRAISYQEFGDYNRLWMDIQEYNASKIYGLTYQETVAGIVIPKNNRPLALLNKDIKSTYAVHVGSTLAPGIAQGNNGENIIIKYIPAWFMIKTGDEVITSGLDQIFFKGLKVGKVLSSTRSQGFQTAVVVPYYKANNPNYFHIIRNVK